MDKRIGTITIIITNRASQSENVNKILSEFGDAIIGRMGIPYSPESSSYHSAYCTCIH